MGPTVLDCFTSANSAFVTLARKSLRGMSTQARRAGTEIILDVLVGGGVRSLRPVPAGIPARRRRAPI